MGVTEEMQRENDVEIEKNEVEENDIKDEEVNFNKNKYFIKLASNVFTLVFFGLFASFLMNSFLLGDNYVDKKVIKSELSSLINNGAGLRAVRFHYDHRSSVKRDILFSIQQDVSLYYKYDVALSEVLEELRTQQFLNGTPDPDFLTKLDKIITEYTDSNPFDKLETGQKDLFENIRVKLTTNYSDISDDINKLSDELSNKNKLVNEYLSDSQTSLIVSIVSAFIAVILAGIQMWQNKSKTPEQVFLPKRPQVVAEYVSENENGERIRTIKYSDGRVMEKTYTSDGKIRNKRSSYS